MWKVLWSNFAILVLHRTKPNRWLLPKQPLYQFYLVIYIEIKNYQVVVTLFKKKSTHTTHFLINVSYKNWQYLHVMFKSWHLTNSTQLLVLNIFVQDWIFENKITSLIISNLEWLHRCVISQLLHYTVLRWVISILPVHYITKGIKNWTNKLSK